MKSEPKAFASLSSGLLARKGAARPAMRPQGFGQGGGNLDDLGWNDMGHDSPRPLLATVSDDGVVPHVARNPLAGLTPISPVHDQQAEIAERFSAYSSDELDEGEEEEELPQLAGNFASLMGGSNEATGEQEDEEEALDPVQELPPIVAARPIIMPPAPVLAGPAPLPTVAPAPAPMRTFAPAPAPAPAQAAVLAPAPRSEAMAPRSEPVARGKAAFTLRLDPARHLKLRLACAVTGRSAQQLVTRALDELLASMPELEAMAQKAPAERVSKGD